MKAKEIRVGESFSRIDRILKRVTPVNFKGRLGFPAIGEEFTLFVFGIEEGTNNLFAIHPESVVENSCEHDVIIEIT